MGKSRSVSSRVEDQVGFTSAADLLADRPMYLWRPYIADGKLTAIVDTTAMTTSVVISYFAAKASICDAIPYGQRDTAAANVLVAASPSAIKKELRAQLQAAGGDLSRIKFVHDRDGTLGIRAFDRELHCELLEHAASLVFAGLIVIEFQMKFTKEMSDLRSTMVRLRKIARRFEIAVVVVLVPHKSVGPQQQFRKAGALESALNAADAICSISNDSRQGCRIFACTKNIVGYDASGIAFHVDSKVVDGVPTASLRWSDSIEGVLKLPHITTASIDEKKDLSGVNAMPVKRDYVSDRARVVRSTSRRAKTVGSKLQEAISFVEEALRHGPIRGDDLAVMAQEQGLKEITLRRAVERLGIRKNSGTWRLP